MAPNGFAGAAARNPSLEVLFTRPRPAASAAAPAAAAASAQGASFLRAAACASLVLALASGRGLCARSRTGAESRVVLHARNPFPTPPGMNPKGQRKGAAGRRAFLRGRQVQVRVNKRTKKAYCYRMHVKPGDTVMVMKGKDAGKVTQVLRIFPKWNRILCLGVNFCIKHVRPKKEDEVGQRVQVEAAFHVSCVQHYSSAQEATGLLGVKFIEENGEYTKVRYNKSTGEIIPNTPAPEWVPVLERVGTD